MTDAEQKPDDGLDGMMRLWANMVTSAMGACQPWTGGTASPELVRETRASAFNAWSEYWEEFLRSPAFLDAQRQAMAGSLESKRQVRECLGRLNHELQLATSEDVDELLRAIKRIEQRVSEQFDELSARLDRLSAQLNRSEQPKPV
jgi:hypothetical protein